MADVMMLEDAHRTLGLWDAQGQDGRYRYRYQLIPGSFTVTSEMFNQFSTISMFVGKALRASTALVSQFEIERVQNGTLPSKAAVFQKMVRSACGGYEFRPDITAVPPVVKVDLMWDGTQFWIAEIDAYNPRGIAYALWLREAHMLAGELNASHLALVEVLRESCPAGGGLVWLYSDRERYYAPVMEGAARVLKKYGVSMRVIGERGVGAFCQETGKGLLEENESLLIVPDRMHQNTHLRNALVLFGLTHPNRLVFPYVPHLGSKALLAFLSNGNQDEAITEWRNRHLCHEGQAGAFAYLPWTGIPGKRFQESFNATRPERVVLKDINGSGTKGVYMPDNPAQAEAMKLALKQKQPGNIAQECVVQHPMCFEGLNGSEEHYVRVTLYVKPTDTGGIPVDAEVTGTWADPLVHGGSSCIQLPAFFPN